MEDAGPGDLPQVLRQLKGRMMLPPASSMTSEMEVGQEEGRPETLAMPSSVMKEGG